MILYYKHDELHGVGIRAMTSCYELILTFTKLATNSVYGDYCNRFKAKIVLGGIQSLIEQTLQL